MIVILTAINELQRRFNDVLGRIGSRLADRGYARNPLVSKPTATTQVYRELAEEVAASSVVGVVTALEAGGVARSPALRYFAVVGLCP